MRDGAYTKERIEQTALRLFVEQGIAETSIREIAKEAGVSLGAMYNHYGSKDDLAWQLFATNFSKIGSELHLRAEEQTTLEEKFSAMIRYVFELFERDWVLVTYVFFARHTHLRRVTPEMGNPDVVFRSVIADAIKRDEIPRQDTRLATSLVIGAVIQVIDSRILGRIKHNLSPLSADVAGRCVRLLKD